MNEYNGEHYRAYRKERLMEASIPDLMAGEMPSTKNARDDLSDILAKVLRKPEGKFNRGVARGLRIALMFIDYHDSEDKIRKLRKGEI